VRVLHYIVSYFPHDRGASHSAQLLAIGLRRKGIEVEFIVEDQGPEWREGGIHEGIPVRSFPLTHPGKLRKLSGFLSLRSFLKKHAGPFDLVHVHAGPYMNLLLARTISRWLHIPSLMKITSDGWDTPDGVRADRHGRMALHLYRKLDAVVAMTSGQAQKCHDWNIPGLIEVIPNGVDIERFKPASSDVKMDLRQTLGLPRQHPVMVYAGWLGDGKGTDVLFQVWNGLRRNIPHLQLLLVGNYMGQETMAMPLKGFLEKYGLPGEWALHPDVHCIGKTPDISPYLRASDLFVFPSRREGFGTVQIEAMACGLPSLVNDLPGVTTDIYPDDTCGIRISNNDVDAYIKAGTPLLENPSKAATMGRLARERAATYFSVEQVADRYADLYRRIIQQHQDRVS